MKLTSGQTSKLFKTLSLLLLIAGLTNAQSAHADQRRWEINVETQELNRQFVYRNTIINPVVKAEINYGEELKPTRPFENVYYHDGKPIGLERKGPFGAIARGDLITVKITHKGRAGEEEYKAAANTILRLTLNSTHNYNPISSIIVPRGSFEQIIGELERNKCLETPQQAEKGSGGALRFNIESDTDGLQKHLYYTPNLQ
jgi:hypothetical protein